MVREIEKSYDKLGVPSENSSRGLSQQQIRYVSFRFLFAKMTRLPSRYYDELIKDFNFEDL